MARKIRITQQQLEEALDVFVNKTPTESEQQALDRVRKETEQQVGNKDVNYIFANDELNEGRIYSKVQILEARKTYLKENSTSYSKANFLKKK